MKVLTNKISTEEWQRFLTNLLEVEVSQNTEARSVLAEIGKVTFQFVFHDRQDLSYWQEYTGNKIIVRLGILSNPDIIARTDLETYILTTAGEISIMEATAEELYDIAGDQEKLWATANIIPFVLRAFQKLMEEGKIPGVVTDE